MAPIFSILEAFLGLASVGFALPCPGQGCSRTVHSAEMQNEMPTLEGLPSNQNFSLAYVAVGVGHQNYTCNGSAYVQSDTSDGALATLYDATNYFTYDPQAIQTLPSRRLRQYNADGQNQFLTNMVPMLPILGEHYFDASLRPNFDLFGTQQHLYLVASKAAAVASPQASNVPWLYLINNPSAGETNGLAAVYRVETAGGVAPSECSSSGSEIQVPYSAEYWFFS